MFCNKCGKEVNDDVVFCPNCGSKLINDTVIKKNSGESEAITGFVLGIVSLVFWVTIIVPILGIYFSSKGKNSPKASYAKAGKILSILSLIIPVLAVIIYLLIFIVVPVVTTVKISGKNTSSITAIPSAEEYLSGQREIFDWYTNLGIIQVKTCDESPVTVRVDIALAYKKDDEATPREITQRNVELKSFLRRYFSNKTAAEIENPNNDDAMEKELVKEINDKILSSSKIRDVVFQTKEVIEQD